MSRFYWSILRYFYFPWMSTMDKTGVHKKQFGLTRVDSIKVCLECVCKNLAKGIPWGRKYFSILFFQGLKKVLLTKREHYTGCSKSHSHFHTKQKNWIKIIFEIENKIWKQWPKYTHEKYPELPKKFLAI